MQLFPNFMEKKFFLNHNLRKTFEKMGYFISFLISDENTPDLGMSAI